MTNQIKKGDKFYLITSKGKFLRKVTYIKDQKLAWAGGYARLYQMSVNDDDFSKVRWILDYRYHERNQLPNPPAEITINI